VAESRAITPIWAAPEAVASAAGRPIVRISARIGAATKATANAVATAVARAVSATADTVSAAIASATWAVSTAVNPATRPVSTRTAISSVTGTLEALREHPASRAPTLRKRRSERNGDESGGKQRYSVGTPCHPLVPEDLVEPGLSDLIGLPWA
jgi:hypothetical protein